MSDRYLARSAVFVVIRDKEGRVLMHRRAGTPYMNGRYDLPSGHVEQGERIHESAVRELLEETGVTAKPEDLELWHINQFSAGGEEYYNFFFAAKAWSGTPQIMEPDKCDDMRFFAQAELPEVSMPPATRVAMDCYGQPPVTFGFVDQATFDRLAA